MAAVLPRTLPPRGVTGLKALLHMAALAPLTWLVVAVFTRQLGANPAEALIHELGVWGLRLLLVTLAITPLRELTGAAWLVRTRRLIGLWAFAYITLHFTAYLVFQQSLDWGAVVEDIIKRPYILVGVSALLLLLPLAVTSTQRWMKRLGARWKRLHRLVYPAAVLGVAHFFLIIKANAWSEPLIYATLLTGLLGYRVVRTVAHRSRRRAAAAPVPEA